MREDFPPELLAQLSCVPEKAPGDFTCIICQRVASNRWNWAPKDYERAPVCKGCERGMSGWPYSRRNAQPPRHGSFRDRREAMRLHAIAEALGDEATHLDWKMKHGNS